MARRGWGGSITTALGVAAGAGAAQLGFGYGLGIINWAPPPDGDAAAAAWTAGLIWATWIAATSTVLGAVWAQRLRRPGPADAAGGISDADTAGTDPPTGVGAEGSPDTGGSAGTAAGVAAAAGSAGSTGTSTAQARPAPAVTPVAADSAGATLGWIALAAAAGIGALVTVLLAAVPARMAVVPDVSAPRNVAAGYAALGVLVGVAVAVWALHSRAAATNVIATVGWLWLLAVVAVVDGVLAGRGLTSAQLGIWQLSGGGPGLWIRDWFYWPGALLSLGSALVIGVLAARHAARYADRRVGATASGAAGPLLVAVAYLLAVPGLAAIDPEQVSAHLIAPYAVVVGLGGSALVAALGQRADRRSAVPVPAQRTGQPADAEGGDAAPTPAAGTRRFGRRKDGAGTGADGPDRTTTDSGGPAGGTAAGGSDDASGTSTASGGASRPGRRTAARTSSAGGDATGRVPTQRTPETEPTEESDAGGRRARSPRQNR